MDFDLEYIDTLDLEAVRELVLPAAKKRRKDYPRHNRYALKAMRDAETLERLIGAVGITE